MQERKVISIESGDEQVRISPLSMTHSIVIAEAEKTDMQEENPADLVDEIQIMINPKYWSAVASQFKEGKISAYSHMALVEGSVEPDIVEPILNEFDVDEDTSIFVRTPTVSLDGGNTEQKIYALIVFKDANPRLIISAKEPLIDEVEITSTVATEQGLRERAAENPSPIENKQWWKFW